MTQSRFAVTIPVGPADVDRHRAVTVLESVLRWEPDVGWCVIVDDAPEERGLSRRLSWPSHCEVVTRLNPRRGRGSQWIGAVSAGVLEALAWIQANTDADFVAKVETDALVIAPFAQSIRTCLARERNAALIGTLGLSCNPEIRRMQDLNEEPWLLRVYRLLPTASNDKHGPDDAAPIVVPDVGRVTNRKRRLFDGVRPHIESAISHGYSSNHYIQGGAYVITRLMLDRMAASGYFGTAASWAEMIFPEEPVMAMYARALNLHLCDYSGPDQPFGVQYIGLPYSPAELVDRGYGFIHSIKNDKRHSEASIVDFFARRAALHD